MKVTKKDHDEVSSLLTVTLDKADYMDKVEKTLKDYVKNARVPGFRKGKVPLGMVRKQYEAGAAYDEINKQVSDALNKYVTEKKLRLVGQPVPEPVEALDYKNDAVSLDFEIGYEPDLKIDLSKYEAVHYSVKAGDKEINQSIENMQKRFATRVPQDEIGKDSYASLEIEQVVEKDAEGDHHHAPKNVTVSNENAEAFKLIKGLKKEGSVDVSKTDLEKNEKLAEQLGFSKHEIEDHVHHDTLKVTVKDIYGLDLATLDQKLFDQVYGEGKIKSVEELRNKVKEELDEYFQQNSDIHFVNKMLDQLVEKEEVKLPEEFLVKWLQFSNEKIKTAEDAKGVLDNEKSQLKYQIIENQLMNDNNIKIEYTDLLTQAEQMVRNQLAMYGIFHLQDEEIQKYAVEMLKDQNQVRQISSEVAMAKLKSVILEKGTKKEEEISNDDFMKELQK